MCEDNGDCVWNLSSRLDGHESQMLKSSEPLSSRRREDRPDWRCAKRGFAQ